MNLLNKILSFFIIDKNVSKLSKEQENRRIICAYNILKEYNSSCEPNYELAEKVFREFNRFNLKNIDEIGVCYEDYIPKSLLPYPKNYIKCAWYIYQDCLAKNKEVHQLRVIQEVGTFLFMGYPDYNQYKKNLKSKKTIDDAIKLHQNIDLRENFKRLYGCYEISEEDYNSSPNSVDCTDEKLIHDFGFLPEIEEDTDISEISEKFLKDFVFPNK